MSYLGPCMCGDTGCPSCGPLLGGPDPYISELQENILELLEDAGMPSEKYDQIVKIIIDWEESEND